MQNMPVRVNDSHKGDYGHVLVIAGSKSYTGAAYLASQSALRSGSGLVTLAIPEGLHKILALKLTEVMTLPLPQTKSVSLSFKAKTQIIEFVKRCNAVAMGPGLSTDRDTVKLVRELTDRIDKPLVVDADAINALAGKTRILKNRKYPTVITPHPGEMARLIKKTTAFIQKNRENVAKIVALEYNCVSILKGHRTVVASPDGRMYINTTGNPGMSTAGMGDVLTGIIVSFIGQGMDPYEASCFAVHVHGKAGDITAKEKGQISLIATDVLEKLPYVLKKNRPR